MASASGPDQSGRSGSDGDDQGTSPAERSEGFRALSHAGFRVYFGGMLLRGTAVWMQMVSLPWLAVELGASPAQLGLIAGFQFLPTLVISPIGGVVADRVDRGRVLTLTQLASVAQAIALAIVASSGGATIPLLAAFALSFGVMTAIELPVRQAYVAELIPRADLTSAVSLHATAWNTTRFIGPGLSGLIIATAGVEACFLASAAAAFAVTVSIIWLEHHRYHRVERTPTNAGIIESLVEGARFAAREPQIRWALLLVTAGGVLGIQVFQTLAPLYVSEALGLGGGGFGAFIALWGGGAVIASYVVTAMARGDRRPWLVGGMLGMAALLGLLAVLESPPLAFGSVIALGFCQIALAQNAMVTVQSSTPDALRGRVMGLYTTLFQGTSPFGAFLAGFLGEVIGIRGSMASGALALGSVAVIGAFALRRARRGPDDPTGDDGVRPAPFAGTEQTTDHAS
ncbi:MAG: MFS transporter [Chloroflexi bacterium]|nr:MFS transporter [Chloroflexota bacterium]